MTFQKLILSLTLFTFLFAGSVNAKQKKQKVADVSVVNLTTERLQNPLSLDTPTPRLGWQILSAKNNVMQTSAQIIVASSREKAEALEGDLWNETINGSQSQWIEYKGKELRSNTRCYWRVKVCTTQGDSEWSDVNEWNVALLNEADWSGRWIGLDQANEWDVEDVHSRLSSRYYRQEFKAEGAVKRATLYICGLGMYEAFINGKKVSDDVLTPAPTDYNKTVLYNAYDVTSMLQEQNAIGVVLGNGRYYTMQQKKKAYKIANFGYPTLRANLIIEYENGKKTTISTDEKWRLNCDGPIRSNNEYDGEIYDARKEFGEWAMPGYDDSKWMNPERTAIPHGTLRGMMTPAMRELQKLPAKSVNKQGEKYIVDFGQNMSGWAHLRVKGAAAGDTISIRYAEKLDSTGNLWTANFRNALSTDHYIANGNENGKVWHPVFSYHGGRYVEVSGLKNLTKDDIWACQVSDNIKQTGTFECADTILNKVMHNALWGILTNYKGMPTDCPQRDERQPWLGDRTAGCLGESYFFDINTLYAKWTRDIVEAQREDGCIPGVAPAFWNYYNDDVTWPAALPMALEMLYDQYGDDQPVRKFYLAVKKWLEHMRYQYGKNGLITRDKYGDWCMPPEKPELIHSEDPARKTDGTLISTAYFYRMCRWMMRFATIFDMEGDRVRFAEYAAETKDAFNKKFLTKNKNTNLTDGNHWLYPDSTFYGNNTVTANLLPYAFGMIDAQNDKAEQQYIKKQVEKNIIENIIVKNEGHVSTGVIGGSWIMRALSDMGRGDVAWLLATNKTYPSWGYMAEKGATTTWELWNGDTANPAMNSGNHVMLLGDLVTWAFQNLGGIQNAGNMGSQGFKHFVLKPDYDVDEINHINTTFNSIYGTIVSRWEKKAGRLTWHFEIPANTTATVYLPNGEQKEYGSGSYDIDEPYLLTSNSKAPIITASKSPISADSKSPIVNQSSSVSEASASVISNEFLYENASFPECHSATIAELPNGDLVATYFGGTKERNPDCCIWVSRKPKGAKEWLAPVLAAHGKMPFSEMGLTREEILKEKLNGEITLRDSRKAAWNPVIFYNKANKQLEIYFKLGINPRDWSGWIVRSKDGGKTWSKRESLGKFCNADELKGIEDLRVLGPVKNKIFELPLLSPATVPGAIAPVPATENSKLKTQTRLIAPTSLELGGWRLYFEISDDGGKTWHRTADVEAPLTEAPAVEAGKPVNAIQPAIIQLEDGRLAAVARTRSEHVAITYSSDNGETWSKLELLSVPNNNSGLDAVTLSQPFDGGYKHVMICNDAPVPQGIKGGKGLRTPLSLQRSKDGMHWEHWLTLEDSPISQYSYPSIIQTKDGNLHCIYTWRRQRIKHVEIKL